MQLKFTKMQGCGNDYIYINCFEQEITDPKAIAATLSDRHFGVGGDGIILVCPSSVADAKMRMFNNDGSESQMCGNGVRCVGKYVYDNHIARKQTVTIETLSGIKTLKLFVNEADQVVSAAVNMGKAELAASKIPVALKAETVINYKAAIEDEEYALTCVSMGNPHCVVFGLADYDLYQIGPKFEKNGLFPESVNTEFASVIDGHTIEMRVWERGSGETLACGTGACAVAVAAVLNGYCKKGEDIRVILAGGELIINYTDDRVLMTGPCEKVFDGVMEMAQ